MSESHDSTRRAVLLGAGMAGLGGALAGCSTSAVPYDANQAGNMPGGTDSSTPGAAPTATGQAARAAGAGTVLGSVRKIPVGGGMIFMAEKVVVTHPKGGKIRAFSAVCTHVGCILNQVSGGTINCPCHGSQFAITDGSVVAGPAPAPLARKRIKIRKGKVILL